MRIPRPGVGTVLICMTAVGLLLHPLGASSDFGDLDKAFSPETPDYSSSESRVVDHPKWSISLGGGYSFISPYYVDIPDFTSFLFAYYSLPPPPGGNTFRRKLQPAGMFEASLTR